MRIFETITPRCRQVQLNKSPAFRGISKGGTITRLRIERNTARFKHRTGAHHIEVEQYLPRVAVWITTLELAHDLPRRFELFERLLPVRGEFVDMAGPISKKPLQQRLMIVRGCIEIAIGHSLNTQSVVATHTVQLPGGNSVSVRLHRLRPAPISPPPRAAAFGFDLG